MTRTITRLFDDYSDAQTAVTELERIGVPHDDLSIVANNAHGTHGADRADNDGINDDGDVTRGASAGAAIGGVGGLLAGLGLLAIPGLGPIVAAGWLASTAVGAAIGGVGGAATGGIVGALKNAGHSDEEAGVYAEGVRRGGTLVSARVEDALVGETEAVLDGNRGVSADTRGSDYKQSGWTGFDPDAAPYSAGEIDSHRAAYRREPAAM
ncbi:general stress protein [Sphingomonas sp. KR3-1]|uniref:general stress protein n=1 Tax=Sphingomonas sp. KR3-1 TaxID=3156611 RepID=UPI0032B44D93